jgi:hypothetical protein
VIVLPGGGAGFCERAGGSDLPPGYRERRERFAALYAAFRARFGMASPTFECVTDYASAGRAARRILGEQGFGDWRIETSPEPIGDGCAAVSLDEPRKIVTINVHP